MTIRISVSNTQKMLYLIEILKTMDFIESLKVEEEASLKTSNSLFNKFYGSLPNLDIEAFENYLTETRNEWERPRS